MFRSDDCIKIYNAALTKKLTENKTYQQNFKHERFCHRNTRSTIIIQRNIRK